VHQLHRQSDAPDAPDYISHLFFEQTYQLAAFQAAYRRDPWGVMQMLQREPKMGKRLGQWRGAARMWRESCPEVFEECLGVFLSFEGCVRFSCRYDWLECSMFVYIQM
jgi:hypothetical protein